MGNLQKNVTHDKEKRFIYNKGNEEDEFMVYIKIRHLVLETEETREDFYTNESSYRVNSDVRVIDFLIIINFPYNFDDINVYNFEGEEIDKYGIVGSLIYGHGYSPLCFIHRNDKFYN